MGGYIDHVRVGPQTIIYGWGLLQTDLGERSVVVDTNLPVTQAAIVMVPRADVATALGDKRLARCGFQIRLNLAAEPAWPEEIRICVWTEDAVYGCHRVRIEHLQSVLVAAPKQDTSA